ncbi:MAG: hypothetical protein U0228_08630 [Myxococcaceae bacterium]
MPTSATSAPLTFDAFWRWVQDHRNCVLRVGSSDVMLMDNELVHWDFFDEDEGRAVVQAIVGKSLVGEVVIERADVLFVQASPDLEQPGSQAWNFELIGGARGENYPLFAFLLSHGMEGPAGHQTLKH